MGATTKDALAQSQLPQALPHYNATYIPSQRSQAQRASPARRILRITLWIGFSLFLVVHILPYLVSICARVS